MSLVGRAFMRSPSLTLLEKGHVSEACNDRISFLAGFQVDLHVFFRHPTVYVLWDFSRHMKATILVESHGLIKDREMSLHLVSAPVVEKPLQVIRNNGFP